MMRNPGAARRALIGLGACALVGLAGGCQAPDMEKLGREALERAKVSTQSVDAAAHAQKIDPEVVKKVQQELTVLKEYMGPINGKLDPVTINALGAFQRSEGMSPDGMFTPRTLDKLTEAAARRRGASSS